jgi:teichoic acid transport system permease protein
MLRPPARSARCAEPKATEAPVPIDPPRPTPGEHLPAPVPPALPDDLLAAYPQLRRVGTKLPLRDYLRELWLRREFAITVPLGELRAQNQDTSLGQLWHLLNPLFLIGIYYFVFGIVLDIEGRRGVDDYLPFLIVGVIIFNYTRSSMQAGARMIVKNRRLVQSINFPRAILPISSIVSETVSHLYALPVMLVLLLSTNFLDSTVVPSFWWLLLIPITVIQALFNLGLSMAVSRFAFHFRDVQNFMPYAIRLWFYMSGVLYPITSDLIETVWIRRLLQLNPAWSIIETARDALLYQRAVWWVWALAFGWTVFALVVGFAYFRRAENEYGRV